MKLKLKILDRYIVRKFIGTYLVIILIFTTIIIIFDVSERINDFVDNNVPLKEIIIDYYCSFVPFLINMFSPLFVFISVIFFTTRLASHSEIVAILAGGISFKKLLSPYLLSATLIALMSLLFSLYVIPPANRTRLEFADKYIKPYVNTSRNIHFQLSPGNYVYLEAFNSRNSVASRFTLETIEGHRIVYKLRARSATWNEATGGWSLRDYSVWSVDKHDVETFTRGSSMDTVINLTINDLGKIDNIVASYNSKDLNEYIKTQKMRGDRNVIYSQVEKHTRLALPFSAFVLTMMGVSLSAQKKRGGMGINLAVGLALSFTYILFLRFSQMFAIAGTMPPWLALWVPNIIYSIIALILYRLAPK